MKALTVQQPWAWSIGRSAVTHTGKGIENRTWTTKYRLAVVKRRRVQWAVCLLVWAVVVLLITLPAGMLL
uniref:hypothetical protein n=1 Tax=Streptosporangium sp. CA-235898 TaxID=3240073 RepID=UPI003F494108